VALELPGWVVIAFNYAGLPWPGIDEDELRAWADSVRRLEGEMGGGTAPRGKPGGIPIGRAAGHVIEWDLLALPGFGLENVSGWGEIQLMHSMLEVTFTGDMGDAELDELRAILGMASRGRLSDDWDAEFGRKELRPRDRG
jgi:hypothetical protein